MRASTVARLLCSCLVLHAAAADSRAQAFTLSGSRILDPAGGDFVPRGANIGLWSDRSGAGTVAKIKDAWRFNAVRVYTRLAGDAANYPSDDATNWGATVYRDLGAPDTRVTFDAPRTARHIKVVCRESHASEWWGIHEFRVFEDAVDPCATLCAETFSAAWSSGDEVPRTVLILH